jgi:hypothetical protein
LAIVDAPPQTRGSELNATCLSEYTDRDINDIADRLEANLRTVIDHVYSKVDFDRLYPFHGGSTISAGGGARWILCELLVHGYDLDLRWWNEIDTGGHFLALEQPTVFVDEVRSFFRLVR